MSVRQGKKQRKERKGKKIPPSACRKKKIACSTNVIEKNACAAVRRKKNVSKLFHHSGVLYKIAAKLQPFSSLAPFELWIWWCCKIIASYVQCIISYHKRYYKQYDGLTEKQCPGSGLTVQHILAQLGTPSHCFYAQLWGTQCRSGLQKGWEKIIRATFQLDHDQLTSILLSHLFWIFQSTFKLQLMILAAITMLWASLNCFLLFLAIFLIKKLNVFTSAVAHHFILT